MIQLLKQSTTRNLSVFMTDSTDHVTGKTGLTLTITASKDGAAFSSITPAVTELANGWYSLALTTTHTNTLGDFLLHITGAGADPTDLATQVVADLPGASVASVSGAVGSVTGAVGSVAGAVGSVTGAVGSVAGAVGSVVGNVGGSVASVVGAVGSVASGVTVTTNNDKTGYALSAAGVQAIWDALTSALTTIGSVGKLLVTNIDAAITSRMASFSYTAPDNAGIAAIKLKTDNLPAIPASQGDVTTVGTAVATLSTKVGTPAGASVSADIAAVKSDSAAIKVKTDSLPAIPASQSDVTTVGTTATAIKAKTDNLPAAPASEGNVTAVGNAVAAVGILVSDIPTNPLLASSYVAPDNTGISAIKIKTDALPAIPASQGDVTTVGSSVAGVQTTASAIKVKTDGIPADPTTTTHLDFVTGEILTAISEIPGGGGSGGTLGCPVIGLVDQVSTVVGYVEADATVIGLVDC